MTRDRFRRIKELFLRAVELPPEEQSALLDRECADDPELRAEVERLLAEGTGISPPSPDLAETDVHPLELRGRILGRLQTDDKPGDTIGPYRLVRPLGEGGMGTVWQAEQTDPVKRTVALKLIKLGMDTRQVVARFESERQALALMSHPNIARVYDAGATETGRPFFVMEHVDGQPITEHCDGKGLGTRERLELFRQVCDALQHAHQKGVIHRDIKPSNVLVEEVDGKAVPKVIDFGIAKATEQRLTERTLFTELGQMVGTPAYMSPEQADPTTVDIDTRTDVYSLGVLLYELLVGVLPFDTKELLERGYHEILRVIREDDPPVPSTRARGLGDTLTDVVRSRSTDAGRLQRDLRGDLDWIVMKALAKEPDRRYASASELGSELGRYLTDEPVTARPPSRGYQLRKFARRNKALVGGVAATMVVLLAGVTVSTVLGIREARARQAEEKAREDLEVVVDFQSDMLTRLDPEAAGMWLFADLRERLGEAERKRGAGEAEIEAKVSTFSSALARINATDVAREMLDVNILSPAGETLDDEFESQPLIEARLRHGIGSTYGVLGLYRRAETALDTAVETRKRLLGDDHPDTLSSMGNLGDLYHHQGRYDEAEPIYLETLEARKRVLGEDHPDTLWSMNSLASLYRSQGRYDEAEAIYLETVEARRRLLGDDHPHTLISMTTLANLYVVQGRYDEAEPIYLETLEARKRVLGDDHPHTLRSMNNLASLYRNQGRYGEAEPIYLETLDARKRVLGDDHPHTLRSMSFLAALYRRQGRYGEAEPIYLETLEARKRVLGGDHPATLESMSNLAGLYRRQGRYDEAEPIYLGTLEARKRVLGDDHPGTVDSMNNLGNLYLNQGRYDEAEALYLETLEARRRAVGDDHPRTLGAMKSLANLYYRKGRYEEAEALYLETLEARKRVLGGEHPDTLGSMKGVGDVRLAQGFYDEAEAIYLETLDARKRVLGEDHPDTLWSVYHLARLEALRGNRAIAWEWLGKAVETGFAGPHLMSRDPDLESLHGPEFDALIERARQNAAARRAK